MRSSIRVALLLFLVISLTFVWYYAGAPATSPQNLALKRLSAPATVTATSLDANSVCSGHFVTHKLPFATGVRLREITTYISNGSGLAVNDLDSDGDLDLVFASVDGQGAILWNQGGLAFESELLDDRFARAAAIVDVDGDGALDIVFTHRGLESLSYWRNQGDSATPAFVRETLPGVDHYAYAMAWGDVNSDGHLDLATGSYAAELKQHGVEEPMEDERAGVVLHLRQGDGFVSHVLDRNAETLSIALVDLTGDGQPEIWAANDFALSDKVWQRTGDEWQAVDLFDQTSYSTMTTEWGDIANSGNLALFTTDMNPYDISPHTIAAWLPTISKLTPHRRADDIQFMSNALLVRDRRGRWQNQATARGVDATGWSWAAHYGDLDQDGHLDLYIVNGMIAADLFGHLDNQELVETNQAFRNRGVGSFEPTPQWQLASTSSGRGMVMADMDGDGDLDIVVNNLRGSAELFENQLCEGRSLLVDLQWSQAENSRSIGAQAFLHTDAGIFQRDVRASGGYLSSDATRLHFGVPQDARLDKLVIVWPDGKETTVEKPEASTLLTVTR
jgi:hypothetical protein